MFTDAVIAVIQLVVLVLQIDMELPFSLFDLDWDVFSSNIAGAINRVPAIETTGIKSTVCGPGLCRWFTAVANYSHKCYEYHLNWPESGQFK